jgi:hypothetical protein
VTPTWADSDPNLGWDISGVSSDLVSKNLVSILSSPQSPDASLRDYDNKYALVLNVSQCTNYDATPTAMIIFKFKKHPETRGEGFPCKAFRDVIEASIDRSGFEFGLFHQYQHKSDGSWNTSHTDCLSIAITSYWSLGESHAWYDGPHCVFSIGFLHIHYSRLGWRCKC